MGSATSAAGTRPDRAQSVRHVARAPKSTVGSMSDPAPAKIPRARKPPITRAAVTPGRRHDRWRAVQLIA